MNRRYGVFNEVYFISSGKFRRYHGQNPILRILDIKTVLLNARDFFKVLVGYFQARRLLQKIKPNAVFSKGGFVVVPVGLAARNYKVPIITHDSDAMPGLANRIIGRWAAIHATGMPAEQYPYPPASIRYTGIPLDDRIQPVSPSLQAAYKKQLEIDPQKKVLLIGGAGLGSRDLNKLVIALAPELLASVPDLIIIHFTGDAHLKEVKTSYEKNVPEEFLKRIKAIAFSDEFYIYTGAADLVISRAGATTIAELALQKKAAILMPASFLSGGHQIKNAERLQRLEAAEIADTSMDPRDFLKLVEGLLGDDVKRQKLADNLGKEACPAAANDVAKLILKIAVES